MAILSLKIKTNLLRFLSLSATIVILLNFLKSILIFIMYFYFYCLALESSDGGWYMYTKYRCFSNFWIAKVEKFLNFRPLVILKLPKTVNLLKRNLQLQKVPNNDK